MFDRKKKNIYVYILFIGVSTTKRWEKSRRFGYGLPEVFLTKGQ